MNDAKPSTRGQRVVDLVRDVGGQLADGGQLRGLDQLGLRLLELGHLLLDALVQARVLDGQRRPGARSPSASRSSSAVKRWCWVSHSERESADQLVLPAIGWMSIDLCGITPGEPPCIAGLVLAVAEYDRPLGPPSVAVMSGSCSLRLDAALGAQDLLGDVIADQRHEALRLAPAATRRRCRRRARAPSRASPDAGSR